MILRWESIWAKEDRTGIYAVAESKILDIEFEWRENVRDSSDILASYNFEKITRSHTSMSITV